MNKAQTDQGMEPAAASAEERAARHLRLLARAAEIQMEVMEATRIEAVEAPQSGVDYCQRIAVITRSLRLTLLLEDRFSRPPEEHPQKVAARSVETADKLSSELRVRLAMGAAAYDGAETEDEEAEASRLFGEIGERLERPELAELVETCPPPVAVARLCRTFGLPEETGRWLAAADAALAELGFAPPDDAAAAPVQAEAVDQGRIRRRLRVIMALGAAIRAGTEDEAECDRRVFEMAGQMDLPELVEIADSCPAVDAVARLCPRFGLPPEEAERWVAESDQFLATMDLPPVDDPPEPPDTG
ncbi:hypothetical protein KXR53_00845 [Inquilinus limosus]|uniref:hypothetical protein n=1 Tax=Inquilinus limosus TaxID=171674 RepID=UPI003F14F9B0